MGPQSLLELTVDEDDKIVQIPHFAPDIQIKSSKGSIENIMKNVVK